MVAHGRLVVVSIVALLHTCFQDVNSRPLPPTEEHSSMEAWAWPYYPLELPDSLIYSYAEMPFGSGPEFPQFSYPEIDLSSLLHEYHQPTGSSTHDGLDYHHHHPSTSHAVSDYHSDLPSDHDMQHQHLNNLDEHGPGVVQQLNHQRQKDHGGHPNAFEVSSHISEMDFGFISTSVFPSSHKRVYLAEDDWGTGGIRVSNAITVLKDRIQMAQKNWEDLLTEIDIRNKQFFIYFTSTPWAIAQLNDPHGPNVASALSPFQEKLLLFLKTDRESSEQSRDRWQTILPPPKTTEQGQNWRHLTPLRASRGSASLAELAIHALGSYYKQFNLEKWCKLYKTDDQFVRTFLRMKVQEYHRNINKHHADQWEQLNILPWEEKDQFDRDRNVQQILKDFDTYLQRRMHVDRKFADIFTLR
ncbi:hypothetical protein PCASD_16461 [Puccinia coronata f. sp. avenae]|uniref:Uncharacterized protein n=1 Tax=Puccinia coronata f. sp. avenae TaxID=200324 RepID=A0A2N5TXG5_9BASI|nr:hypothetical protein PCASD_16461 [Puccinia coronata f. sp. avenae]